MTKIVGFQFAGCVTVKIAILAKIGYFESIRLFYNH